jgi:DNA polymerase-3 subunit gamma/tau
VVADTPAPGQLGLVDVRQLWPGVLNRVKHMKRYAWMLLSKDTVVKDVHDGTLVLGMREGQRANFLRGGHHEVLQQALIDELGVDWKVEVIIDAGEGGPSGRREPPQADPRPSEPASSSPAVPPPPSEEVQAAKSAIRPTRNGNEGRPGASHDPTEIGDDDEVVSDENLSSHELLARELGAQVIDEQETR